jgi:Fe-S cluster biogenesis protein NfuA
MADDQDLQSRIQRISTLVGELENIAQPELRASAKALFQLILDLNAAGFERVLETVARNGESGQKQIDELGRDGLISSLLVLYGLHPLDMETRVERALEKIRPQVRKGGGELELVSQAAGMVQIRMEISGHACGSTGKTLKKLVEDAVYEAAPDVAGVSIEGLDEGAANGFVSLGKLGTASVTTPAS